jgi:hypothetical protein
MKNAQFTPMFSIYKVEVTEKPVNILKKEGEPFNLKQKIAFYLSLGYTVNICQ